MENPLANTPEYILAYMAPMAGPGAPYRDELIRRQQNGSATGERLGDCVRWRHIHN